MWSVTPREPGDARAGCPAVRRRGHGRAPRARDVAPHPRRAYAMARRQLDAWLEGRPLDDVSLAAYLGHLHEAGRAPATAAMVVATVKRSARDATPSTTFETFPFPAGLAPDVPAAGLCGRPAGDRRRRGRPTARRAPRPLAEPARKGRVGGRAGSRLPAASRAPRRGRREGAPEAHPDEPLQRPPAVARRRAHRARYRRRGRLRLAGRQSATTTPSASYWSATAARETTAFEQTENHREHAAGSGR